MISLYPCDRRCAVCAKGVRVGTNHRARRPEPTWLDGGLDGRPGWPDIEWLAHAWYIEECPECGHLAPNLFVDYPGLARAREGRREILALHGRDARALRCLAVANLFNDDMPREQGFWLVRAAWFDEATGHWDAARAVRRRAAPLLEEALFEGFALQEDRLGSALLVAECYRISGDFDRALEHVARVRANTRGLDHEAMSTLVYEIECITQRRTTPATRREACAAMEKLSKEHLRGLQRVADDVHAKLAPLRLRPRRPSAQGEYRNWSAEAETFAHAYIDDDLLIQLLADGRMGIWEAVSFRPRFFPKLLGATDHPNSAVRAHALFTLSDKPLGFEAGILREHRAEVIGLSRRLGDDDPQHVRWAGAIAKQIIRLDPSYTRILVDAARAALPRWHSDLPTQGVLERLIG